MDIDKKTMNLMFDELEKEYGSFDDTPYDEIDIIKRAFTIGYNFANGIESFQQF